MSMCELMHPKPPYDVRRLNRPLFHMYRIRKIDQRLHFMFPIHEVNGDEKQEGKGWTYGDVVIPTS